VGAEADAQVGHEVTVIDVTGPAGFLRVVADLGSLLVAVERLDGDIDVENPRQAQCGRYTAKDVGVTPVSAQDAQQNGAHDIGFTSLATFWRSFHFPF